MLSFLKTKVRTPKNRLFRITIHIGRGTNPEMPSNLVGAHVPVFVGAADHELAAHKAVASLSKRGFEFLDISDRQIQELDPTKWDAFVQEVWSEFAQQFPTQQEVLEKLDSELLFTGPFASYEAPRET